MKTFYEDDYILVINKPAGVEVSELPHRPAHRLDKDTSGLLAIAKNEPALTNLQEQFKNRRVKKEYLAVVVGDMKPEAGEIVTDIVRDPSRRVPFKAIEIKSGLERGNPRVAKTQWQTLKKITVNSEQVTLLKILITTGRTHQIRVHLKYLGYPILGDMVYYTKASKEASRKFNISRQLLHAAKLQFNHPATGKPLAFESAPLWENSLSSPARPE